MEIRENVILAPYTTFRIGGPARYFCEVASTDDLNKALQFSKQNDLRFFVLGSGSNILFSDQGFNGLVIKMGIKGLEFNGELLSIGAGEDWDGAVAAAVERNLGGIENLSLIPGTAGAAVYQNIGAYGVELKDVLENVEILDMNSGEIKSLTNAECKFGYRDSVFKNIDGLIILNINLRLSKDPASNIKYPDLAVLFSGKNPTLSETREAVVKIRRNKLPYPDEIGNAGSFFKNPIVTSEHYDGLKMRHTDLKGFKLENGTIKLLAAQLIEKCGWKGKTCGNVGVSDKHSLVLVNYGKGTAEEVLGLAKKIKKVVRAQFSVDLEPEVEVFEESLTL